MAARGLRQVKNENFAFMSCIIRVNTRSAGWQKTVMKVLKNVKGVSNFKMDEDGMVEVSGTVDPNLLLKMLAKAGKLAELCWFQFGECSSNLYMPDHRGYYDYNYNNELGYYGNGRYFGYGYHGGSSYINGDGINNGYLQYGGFGDRPRPKRPFHNLARRTTGHVQPPGGAGEGAPRAIAPPMSGEGVSCCSLM